jgi:anti-sigma factor RsiW
MSCGELVELVTAYLDGALPPAERARFDAHLARCEPCVVYVRQIEDTIAVVGATREELACAPAVQALLPRFRGWARSSPGKA